jgi:hypothetical protein
MLRYLDSAIAFAVVMLGASLLTTVVTQMISALLASRGTNLRWGLTTLIETLAPGAKVHAGAIVERVLRHPLISGSAFTKFKALPIVGRWQLASAIRGDELIAVLQNLYETASDPNCADAELTKISGSIKQALNVVTVSPLGDIPALMAEIQKLQAGTDAAQKRAKELVESVHRAKGEFKFWFDAGMARVSQRFAMQMRIWTVAAAVLLAFGTHLDSLQLIQKFWADPVQRDALVAAAADMSAQAGEMLGERNASLPAVYTQAMTDLQSGQFADQLKTLNPPPAFATRIEGENWLRSHLAGNAKADAIIQEYQSKVSAALQSKIAELRNKFSETETALEEAKFDLVPSPYPGWDTYWFGRRPSRHFWGTLASAILLSLGAPFWFNSLKSLTNLRPLLAQKQKKEDEEASA